MTTVVSHSELDQYLSCEFKHYYAHGKQLEPVEQSDGLFRGNVGHAAMEAYYKTLMQDQGTIDSWHNYSDDTWAKAKDEALNTIIISITENPNRSPLLMKLYELIDAYCDYYQHIDKDYFILACEEEFRIHYVEEDIIFPFKPDLVRMNKYTRKVEVVDHKILLDFYGDGEMALMPQLPKYIGSFKQMGVQADDGLYNIIRHREMKDKSPENRFKRVPLNVSKTRMETNLDDQMRGIRTMMILKSLPLKEWRRTITRTASSFNCKNCPFQRICISDLEGRDTSVMERVDYKPNTYGYDGNNDHMLPNHVYEVRTDI